MSELHSKLSYTSDYTFGLILCLWLDWDPDLDQFLDPDPWIHVILCFLIELIHVHLGGMPVACTECGTVEQLLWN